MLCTPAPVWTRRRLMSPTAIIPPRPFLRRYRERTGSTARGGCTADRGFPCRGLTSNSPPRRTGMLTEWRMHWVRGGIPAPTHPGGDPASVAFSMRLSARPTGAESPKSSSFQRCWRTEPPRDRVVMRAHPSPRPPGQAKDRTAAQARFCLPARRIPPAPPRYWSQQDRWLGTQSSPVSVDTAYSVE